MQITSRFTIAVHMLLCMDVFQEEYKVTSEFMAFSIGVNPVIVRKLLSQLKDAGLAEVRRGRAGLFLPGRWTRSHFWTFTGRWTASGKIRCSIFTKIPTRTARWERISTGSWTAAWPRCRMPWSGNWSRSRWGW